MLDILRAEISWAPVHGGHAEAEVEIDERTHALVFLGKGLQYALCVFFCSEVLDEENVWAGCVWPG